MIQSIDFEQKMLYYCVTKARGITGGKPGADCEDYQDLIVSVIAALYGQRAASSGRICRMSTFAGQTAAKGEPSTIIHSYYASSGA